MLSVVRDLAAFNASCMRASLVSSSCSLESEDWGRGIKRGVRFRG